MRIPLTLMLALLLATGSRNVVSQQCDYGTPYDDWRRDVSCDCWAKINGCGDDKANCDAFERTCQCREGGKCFEDSFEKSGCPCTEDGKSELGVAIAAGTAITFVTCVFGCLCNIWSRRKNRSEMNEIRQVVGLPQKENTSMDIIEGIGAGLT
mmetsp:Transcript_9552/g.14382  ORF Transcript_9552/g.14382 Transcript_9552/m.14382 type:complete len:153 (+) Transcript_9552:110-568(+)